MAGELGLGEGELGEQMGIRRGVIPTTHLFRGELEGSRSRGRRS